MAPAQPGRQNKVSAFFRQKKDWVKLNASYLVGTVTATTCAYGAAYVAEKAGMDRMQATTWVAGLAAYVTGTAAICLGWQLGCDSVCSLAGCVEFPCSHCTAGGRQADIHSNV